MDTNVNAIAERALTRLQNTPNPPASLAARIAAELEWLAEWLAGTQPR